MNRNMFRKLIAAVMTALMLLSGVVPALAAGRCPLYDGGQHRWGNWNIITEATCSQKGLRVRYCRCGETEREEISKTKHSYGIWTTTKESTCTQTGTRMRKCKVCGYKQTDTVDKKAHKWGQWITITEPTPLSAGLREHTCSACGTTKQEKVYPEGTLKNGDRGDEVKALQEMLNKQGYDAGKADGIFGQKTENAIKEAEADRALPQDGIGWPGLISQMMSPINRLHLSVRLVSEDKAYGEGGTIGIGWQLINNTGHDLSEVEVTGDYGRFSEGNVWVGYLEKGKQVNGTLYFTVNPDDYWYWNDYIGMGEYTLLFEASGVRSDGEREWSESELISIPMIERYILDPYEGMVLSVENVPYVESCTENDTLGFKWTLKNTTDSYITDWVVTYSAHDEQCLVVGGLNGSVLEPYGETSGIWFHTVDSVDVYLALEFEENNGNLNHSFYAYGYSPDGNDIYSNDVSLFTRMIAPETKLIFLDKSFNSIPRNGKYYTEGEEIKYQLVLYNESEETIYDVEITDPLKGNNEDAIIALGETLEPDSTHEYGFSYTVTAEDVEHGALVNVAYAAWDGGKTISNRLTAYTTNLDVDGNVVKVYDTACLGEEYRRQFFVSAFVEGYNYMLLSTPVSTLGNLGLNCETDVSDGIWATVYGVPNAEGTAQITYEMMVDEQLWLIEIIITVEENIGHMFSEDVVKLVKECVSEPQNGKFYVEGEEIAYMLRLFNYGTESIHGVEISDFPKGRDENTVVAFGETVKGAGKLERAFRYTVTKEDVAAGSVANQAYAEWTDGYSFSDVVEVPTGRGESFVKVTDTARVGEAYDREFRFKDIISGAEVYQLQGWDEAENTSIVLEGLQVVSDFSSNIQLTGTPRYTGTFPTTYTVQADGEEWTLVIEITVENTELLMPNVYVVKTCTSTPEGENGYAEGESVHYMVEIFNESDENLQRAELTDPLHEDNDFVIAVPAQEKKTVEYTYIVTEADALRGYIDNAAWLEYRTEGSTNTYVTCSNTVRVKTWTKPDYEDTYLKIEDTAYVGMKYERSFAYDGIMLSHAAYRLEGVNSFESIGIHASQIPNKCLTLAGTPTDAGKKTSIFYIYADDERLLLEVEINVLSEKESDNDITLRKMCVNAPKDQNGYAEDENIYYMVQIFNDGDEDVKKAEFIDELEDTVDFIISVPAHGVSIVQYSYPVTAEDVQRGYIENIACLKIPNDAGTETYYSNMITVYTKREPVFVMKPRVPTVTLVKECISSPADGSAYVENETVTYRLSARLDTGEYPNISAWIEDSLVPSINGSYLVDKPLEYSYTVTAEDAQRGYIDNTAELSYKSPVDDRDIYVKSNMVRVQTQVPSTPIFQLNIVKKEISEPENKKYYRQNEIIRYEIVCTNTGTETLKNIIVYDALYSEGSIDYIYELAPNAEHTSVFEYKVTGEDVDNGYVKNTASAYFNYKGTVDVVASDPVISPTGKDPVPPRTPSIEKPVLVGDCCVRSVTKRSEDGMEYTMHYCQKHYATQMTVQAITAAAKTPEAELKAWQYARGFWQNNVEEMYAALTDTASDAAKAVVSNEKSLFEAQIETHKAALDVLYPDAPERVAKEIAELYMNKCTELCYELHTAPRDRVDSLPAAQSVSAFGKSGMTCSCIMLTSNGADGTYREQLCASHGIAFAMADMMVENVGNTAKVWQQVEMLWQLEMEEHYTELQHTMEQDSAILLTADMQAFKSWLDAREALLKLMYPGRDEVTTQVIAQTVMNRVTALCEGI